MNDSPIKVLQVFSSLNMGGAESRMMDVYRHLDTTKIQFDFVTLSDEKQFFEDEIENLGGSVYKLHSPREVGVYQHIKELRECMHKNSYSAVHAHTSYHCGIVMLAAWLEHVPVRIAHARTTGSKSTSKAKRLSIVSGRWLIRLFSTHRLAISKKAGEFVFGNSQFEVLPNAIDVNKYQNTTEKEIDTLKRKLNISGSEYVIGQIGRFDPMKNHTFTVNWFSEFIKESPESKLILVGDGQLRENIARQAQQLGVDQNVVFTGVRSDVPELIHCFDVLFFPSVFEGLGGVVIEAQAAGVPVVMSDAIPTETDMNLGLIQRISLKSDLSDWTSAVIDSRTIIRPTFECINRNFEENKYTLSAEISRLSEIYRGVSS